MELNVDANVAAALTAIKNGMDVQEAAKKFNLDQEELSQALSGEGEEDVKQPQFGQYGDYIVTEDARGNVSFVNARVANEHQKVSAEEFYAANPELADFKPQFENGKLKFVKEDGQVFNDSAIRNFARAVSSNAVKDLTRGFSTEDRKEIAQAGNFFEKFKLAQAKLMGTASRTDENGNQIQQASGKGLGVVVVLAAAALLAASCQEQDMTANMPEHDYSEDIATIIKLLEKVLDKLDTVDDIKSAVLYIQQLYEKGADLEQEYLKKIYNAILDQNLSVDEINDLLGELLPQYLEAFTENNEILHDIYDQNKENTNEIVAAINEVNLGIQMLGDMIQQLPSEFYNEFSQDLSKIYFAIERGNTSLANIQGSITSLANKIEAKLDLIYSQAAENGKTQEEIRDLLESIKTGQDKQTGVELSQTKILLYMFRVLQNIDFGVKQINSKLDDVIQQMVDQYNLTNDFKEKMEAAVATLAKKMDDTNANLEKQEKLLKAIYEAIGKLGADQQDYYIKIINAISNQGEKIDDVIKLLNTINANVVQGNEDSKAMGNAILVAIAELGDNSATNLDKIYKAVLAGNMKLTTMTGLINQVSAYVQANTAAINANTSAVQDVEAEIVNLKKLGNDILQAVIDNKVDLEPVTTLLNTINTSIQEVNKAVEAGNSAAAERGRKLQKLGEQILAAITSFDKGTTAKLTALLTAVQNNKFDPTTIENLIKNLTTTVNKTSNQQIAQAQADTDAIIAAINALGDKIKPGDANYTQYFEDIKKLLESINKNVITGNAQNLSIGNKLLTIVNHVDTDIHTISKTATDISNKISTLNANNINNANLILQAIENKVINPSVNIDLSKVLEKLDKILAAIKDHDVKVTVDVTGKVKCECNCNCGSNNTHEGIIGDINDLNDLLG